MADVQAVRRACFQWISGTYKGVYANAASDVIIPDTGNTSVLVSFDQLPTGQVLIEIRAPILENVRVTDELINHVAWNATSFDIGSLSLHSDDAGTWLQFSYSLFGEMATQPIVNQIVAVVGQTADQLATQLQPVFGGTFVNSASIDDRLALLVHPDDAYSRKLVAGQQRIILDVLESGDDAGSPLIVTVAVDETIAVITDERTFIFCNGQLDQEILLSEISDCAISAGADAYTHVTATPDLDLRFLNFNDANAFLVQLDQCDIQVLYPDFFNRILSALDLPTTPTNTARLIERVARMIVIGAAYPCFDQMQDASARKAFDERFKHDLDTDEIGSICDDMIDWLWTWNANCHDALRRLVPRIERLATEEGSGLRKIHGKEIPELEW
jgi:hypothetical protein